MEGTKVTQHYGSVHSFYGEIYEGGGPMNNFNKPFEYEPVVGKRGNCYADSKCLEEVLMIV